MSFHSRYSLRRKTVRRQSYFTAPICLAFTVAFIGPAAFAQTKPPPNTPPAKGQPAVPNQTIVQNFQHLTWNPESNSLSWKDQGNILYTDENGNITTLQAKDLQINQSSGDLSAKGGIVLQRNEGTFRGQDIEYNLATKIGYLTDASLESDYFRMAGKRIDSFSDGSYKLTHGEFTTCTAGRPDYKFRVSSLTYFPNRSISARNITFYLGPTALFPIPSLRRRLNEDRGPAIPFPGYSKEEGLTFRLQDSILDEIDQTLDFDLRIGYRRLPTGFFVYQSDIGQPSLRARPPRTLLPILSDPLSGFLEQINPPTYREYSESHYTEEEQPRQTFYATIQNQLFVYNRRRTDLNVSRYPEVGVRFVNMLGHTTPPHLRGMDNDEELPPRLTPGDAIRRRVPNAPALLNVSASLGELIENPTTVSASRLAFRANLASQPLLLGKRLSWRFGLSDWFNLYSTGSAYNIISPEIELDYLPTRTSVFNVAYRYSADNGTTPFLFDRQDVRHELRLQYQVSGLWAFGVQTKFDLERSRAYDTQLAIVRNYDCMQIGLAYRSRGQSLNLIFNLLPPTRDRSANKMPLHIP